MSTSLSQPLTDAFLAFSSNELQLRGHWCADQKYCYWTKRRQLLILVRSLLRLPVRNHKSIKFVPQYLVFISILTSFLAESEHVVQEAIDDMISGQRSLAGDPSRSMTVVIVAHRLSTIRSADNIVVIRDGTVAEQGTHEELLSDPNGVYSGLVRRQLGHSESSL